MVAAPADRSSVPATSAAADVNGSGDDKHGGSSGPSGTSGTSGTSTSSSGTGGGPGPG